LESIALVRWWIDGLTRLFFSVSLRLCGEFSWSWDEQASRLILKAELKACMQGWPVILEHAIPFVLCFFRMLGLFLSAPLLSSMVVPVRTKAMLAMMLSAAIYPAVSVQMTSDVFPGGEMDVMSLLPMIVVEAVIGFSIGLLATVPLTALEMAGTIMGQQMGLGLARVYNPEADYDIDVLGQLLFYIASGMFFALGGLDVMLRAVIGTFEALPVGGMRAGETPLELLLALISSSFDLAMRVSAPVAGIVLLLVIVFAAIGKTMPQINIMSVGFAIKILGGVLILTASLYAVQGAAGDSIRDALVQVRAWAAGLGS
jgi:flagellar biosynthesis protein FliR